MVGFKKFSVLGQKISFLLAASTLLLACTPRAENIPVLSDAKFTSYIVNGKNVADSSPLTKSTVLLVNSLTQDVCTATLLGGTYALTAAHCLDKDNQSNLYVFFGAAPSNQSVRRQVIAGKASPYWALRQNESKDTGDIAVIKFEGTGLPEGFEAAEFLTDTSAIKNGAEALILGYGVTDPTTTAGAGVLRMGVLPVLNANFSSTEILLDQSKGARSCHGDSGGPSYVRYLDTKTKKAKYLLWGIASRGVDDDYNTCENAVAYTNVTLYLVWIQNVLKTL